MGSTPQQTHNSGQMVSLGNVSLYRLVGTLGSQECLPSVLVPHRGQISHNHVACMFYINKLGGARSPSLYAEAIKLWNWCTAHQIQISADYLSGVQHVTAK